MGIMSSFTMMSISCFMIRNKAQKTKKNSHETMTKAPSLPKLSSIEICFFTSLGDMWSQKTDLKG